MPILDHFGIIAPIYEIVIKPKLTEHMAELVGLPVDGLVLDAGGGTGRIAQTMTGMARQVVVADLSYKMLRQAARKGGLATIQSHTERLPFANDAFDAIVMVDALHHVCDQAETASELFRVLHPGGRLVIEEPNIRTLSVKLVALAEKLALMRSHFLSPEEISLLFNHPSRQTRIETDGWQAWVVVEKKP